MAALAHVAVGLAAKRAAPRVPLVVLLASAWALDILWGVFYFAGLDHLPDSGRVSPWSHGLLMAVVWSLIAALAVMGIRRDRRMSVLIGLLVLSHWVVDFISQPMGYSFPGSQGPPLLFEGSPTVGLGLYNTALGQHIGEYASLALGAIVYVFALLKIRRDKLQRLAGGLAQRGLR